LIKPKIRQAKDRLRSSDYGMTDIAKGENARAFMIQNFEYTKKWEDKAGNT